ncbi:site-2 protease family protein [Planktothrix sp. FACHB-1355]|uniref:Zinc metalloprotease n=1 Tax=Aerosakkonema funiforme FACHB-1375 TaxID=2949571 RepID=A0A926VNG0_9CYAN|nr:MULTISPECIES: site-2 protease family protein [Oscillatoriales]MBD2186072.1 site-2 protease family protein [Aerosakkonema funiforme FACHB-1375]MBD3560262.1 site-2 protease family protein [Planktothrix sp. FACHB-1355]
MNGTFRVGNLFGIPFNVHPSWFLILGLVTWTYGNGLAAAFPGLFGPLPWILGLVTGLLLFASVLAHELGHSFVAISQGIEVKSINLFLFGGLAQLEKESKTPAEAFWIAIAGPIVSLLLFGIFTAIGVGTHISGPVAAILGLLASINLALALFNLIPGLPLDGGNILKAAVWKVTGNPYKGIIFASRVGQIFGWIAIASGLLPLVLYGSTANFWNLLVGWFLLQNAGQSAQYATVQDKLAGLTAEDAVIPDSPIVSADTSLRKFANDCVIGQNRWRKFLVTDEDGQLVGAIAVDDLKTVSLELWPQIKVRELTRSIAESNIVKSNQSLLEVTTLIEQKQITQLPVIRDNGVLVGLLEKTSIIELLQRQAQPA